LETIPRALTYNICGMWTFLPLSFSLKMLRVRHLTAAIARGERAVPSGTVSKAMESVSEIDTHDVFTVLL
jgi:hypothetical protein